MKKTVRILVPILLALAVIGTAVWYLFVYDQGFTRDMLLYGARRMESAGKHSVASWLYNCAYAQAGGSDEVILELAQQYRSSGNYTKAEYTLSNAIADGGSKDLYIALCETYVEQDKLLDAVNFLNNIADPDIKAELDAMRPAIPTVGTEPGIYNYYLTVEVFGEGGTLYATADGAYPSVSQEPYSAPLPLSDGENIIYALVVSDNGLVSPLGIFGYTIGGIIQEVNFTDPAMEAALREAIQAPEGSVVMTNELWEIKSFTVPAGAKDLSDLRFLPFLQELTIEKSIGKQLSVLSGFANLETLTVIGTPVYQEEVPVIGSLPSLTSLTLQSCSLSTISGLENATELVYLDLSGNTIRDITPLANCSKLQQAKLQHNVIADVTTLAGCTGLTVLDLSYNDLENITPLSGLKSLVELQAAQNRLTQLPSMSALTQLKTLDVSYNSLTSLEPLSACTVLSTLNVSNNHLQNIAPLASLGSLTELDFSYNEVQELPKFQSDSQLMTINGSYNQLSSLEALRGLPALNRVYMDYNKDLASVEPLVSCETLVLVNIYGTKVTKVTALTDQGIVVNYTPV